jgi:hypothetical protein
MLHLKFRIKVGTIPIADRACAVRALVVRFRVRL